MFHVNISSSAWPVMSTWFYTLHCCHVIGWLDMTARISKCVAGKSTLYHIDALWQWWPGGQGNKRVHWESQVWIVPSIQIHCGRLYRAKPCARIILYVVYKSCQAGFIWRINLSLFFSLKKKKNRPHVRCLVTSTIKKKNRPVLHNNPFCGTLTPESYWQKQKMKASVKAGTAEMLCWREDKKR